MNELIKLVLKETPDKSVWNQTTSLQFKSDLVDWCGDRFKDDIALEVGSHVGHTTRILGLLFKEVYTINLNPPGDSDHSLFEMFKTLEESDYYRLYKSDLRNTQNHNFENVYYVRQDAYGTKGWCPKIPDVKVCFIDAVHTYDAVSHDIENALLKNTKYFVFDDYGLFPQIKNVVDDYIGYNVLKVEKRIGWDKGIRVVGGKERTFNDSEGIICSRV